MGKAIVIAVLFASVVGCMENPDILKNRGRLAFRAGIPVSANPYLPSCRSSDYWIEGYIEEKEKQKDTP